MMCFFVRRKLLDFSEHNLSQKEAVQVREHLKHCLSCQKELAFVQKGLAAVLDYRPPRKDEVFWKDFDSRLWKKIQEAHAPQRAARFPLWKPAIAVLPVIAATLAVLANLPLQRAEQKAQEAVLVKETAWLVSEARDPGVLSAGEDDPTDEMEDLYVLDPAIVEKIS